MALKKYKALAPAEMVTELRQYINTTHAGNLHTAAAALSTSHSHLSEILSGKRSVGAAIAAQLGFELVKEKKVVTVSYYLGSRA